MIKLTRYKNNPILKPTENWWETTNVFNAAATIYGQYIFLLYRAKGNDSISRFGLAASRDGFHFERHSQPTFEGSLINPYERLGVEDPRITKIGETYYIFYTGASLYPAEEMEKEKPKAPYLSKLAPRWTRNLLIKTTDLMAIPMQ